MKEIRDEEFGGERPLFAQKDLRLVNVTINPGESALKRCDNIVAEHCTFKGKYPFWHCHGFKIIECTFTEGGRAALWYSTGCEMERCTIEAPKMFREMQGIKVRDTDFPNGQEMLWDCSDVVLERVKISNCDYLFSHSRDIRIADYEQHGNYTFQYCRNVEIDRAVIHSKDAFWNTENVTIRDTELHGEYLAWYSNGLTLINCRISGTQPLCYCRNLTLINCVFDADCDLAFEESDVRADISSPVTSIKNPRSGVITADSVGSVILDSHILPDSAFEINTKE